MKRFLLFVTFSLISFVVFSQQVSIKGIALDQATSQPLGFVSVALFNGEAYVKGVSANDKGAFHFENIVKGTYTLKVSFTGYDTFVKKFIITGKNAFVDLGNISIKENSKTLKEVEVVAQGSQMKLEVDKKVFSVDQNIASTGGSVTDVLQNVPSVNVDEQGNISLRNNSNVEVWINGKPSGLTEENRATVLQQMPAGTVESIELITNPSAKYSPEGTAGIINLVLKKDRKAGCFGSASAGIIYPMGTKLGEQASFNVNYNKNKVEAYFNVGMRNWLLQQKSISNRDYLLNKDTTSILNQTQNSSTNMAGINGRFGLTYHLTEKHSISISGFGLTGKGYMNTDIFNIVRNTTDSILSNYQRLNTGNGFRNMASSTLDYDWMIDKKGSDLSSNLSYSFFNTGKNGNYLQTINSGSGSPLNQNQTTDASNKTIQFKTDFVKKSSAGNKFEAGVDLKSEERQSTSSAANNNGIVFVDVPTMYNNFFYKEQISALYSTYSLMINKISLQGGLRAEYTYVNTGTKTTTDTVSYKNNNFQLFPSAFCSYSISKNDELQLNYTRRTNRPKGQQLNSFHNSSDSTDISYGNPNLKPELSNSLELNYVKTWKGQQFSSSIYYKTTDNIIQQVHFINSGVLNTTYMNVSQSQSTGLELISKNALAKFLNLTSTVNVYYYKLNSSSFSLPSMGMLSVPGSDNFAWNARLMANFLLSKTFAGQITGNYNSKKAIAQGESLDNYSIDLGIRNSFFNKKLNIALTIRDVLNSKKNVSITSSSGFTQYSKSYTIDPNFGLNLSYNFGTGNSNKKKSRTKDKQPDDLNNDQDMEEF